MKKTILIEQTWLVFTCRPLHIFFKASLKQGGVCHFLSLPKNTILGQNSKAFV